MHRQTTVITFIFRINAFPFPLCRHISQRGRADFFLLETQAVKIMPFLHPWRSPSPIPRNNLPLCLSSFTPPASVPLFSARKGRMTVCRLSVHLRCERRRRRKKMRNPDSDLFLSITISLHSSIFSRSRLFASQNSLRVRGHLKAFFPCLPVFSLSARTSDC